MKKTFSATTFALVMACMALTGIMIYSSSCKREPVFVGYLSPDPVDTTGGGGGGTVVHPCDADSIYFSLQVQPILTSNCAKSGCHDAITHEEGVIYDNYTNTRNTGKISISNPTGSKLYKSITTTDPGDRMPPAPAASLTSEEKAIILKWMQQGAQNLTCDAACDTTNVTFSGSVWPVIQTHCKGCHSGNSPGGGIAYTNYAQVYATVGNGKLMGSVNHSAGFKPMPYPAGNAKLDNCAIRKLQIWIDKGALND